MALIAENLKAIETRIEAACIENGRDPKTVRLLPVTKGRSSAEILAAASCGYSKFAENRVQEAASKAETLAAYGIEWSFIGHVQTNKAKQVATFASQVQSLDSLKLASALERHLQESGKGLDVLIQVNTSAESSKSGLPPVEVVNFAKQLTAFSALRVCGLMTIALPSADQALVAACFIQLQRLQRELRELGFPGQSYDELSMGMSQDFELAIAHGSTQVRIGTGIFGSRPALNQQA
ncbi:MAG: YggS family pyridoxal phosphate-dependent enzyme [Propionibacteriaceae bacterium]|nr:YggS family pyridoxal phosphate-dependent enzyme [Propionibacteriaceae bacterium]